MYVHLFLISIVYLIIVGLNVVFFGAKFWKKKQETQLYLLFLYLSFASFGFIRVVASIQETSYGHLNIAISGMIVTFLFATALGLYTKLKLARVISFFGFTLSLLYIILDSTNVFTAWSIDEGMYWVMVAYSGTISTIGCVFLFNFAQKSKLSPLIGLFFGILIPTVYHIIAIFVDTLANDVPGTYMLMLINVIMFLGFMEKLDWSKK